MSDESVVSWLERTDRVNMVPSTGHEGSLCGLIRVKMMWILLCGLHNHLISPQLTIDGTSALPEMTKYLFWKNCVHSSS